jgi:hypothetical protein
LINIHALSGQLLEGRFPIYYLGASGHEPLYHHLHAGAHAVLGFNVLSGHVLSVAFGLLSIALTYALVRRLFPTEPAIAAVAALPLAVSFWSLMYSRTAIRHISLPPLALGTFYTLWRQIDAPRAGVWGWGLTGLLLGATLYTYTAARLVPVLLAVFTAYLALVHRDLFHRHWRGMAVALVVMALLVAPLVAVVAEGRTRRAIEGIGADARVTELAGPLRDLRDGNPRPVLRSMWKTLGMFHATGDPEWLYNIPGRPVFNLLGGALFWVGVGLCLYRWRRPRYFFVISWLGLGLLPAFVSVPAASLGHTILAQPAAYILPAVSIIWIHRQVGRLRDWYTKRTACAQSSRKGHRQVSGPSTNHPPKRQTYGPAELMPLLGYLLAILFLTTQAVRDLRDYFVVWPQHGMVRLLYRSDYREVARWLNAQSELTDVAIGSALMGPWDRLALEVDIQREDVAVRLFNPERALISAAEGSSSPIILTSWPDPALPIAQTLESEGSKEGLSDYVKLHLLPTSDPWHSLGCGFQTAEDSAAFDNGLTLADACWVSPEDLGFSQEGGASLAALTIWRVAAPLDLPSMPIVANPPPPEVYSGPRLAVFAHLLDAQGVSFASDDGLWVDPLTLRTGDRFIQLHRLSLPSDAPEGPYTLELGLYDPKTGDRRKILDSEREPYTDRFLLPGPRSQARSLGR